MGGQKKSQSEGPSAQAHKKLVARVKSLEDELAALKARLAQALRLDLS